MAGDLTFPISKKLHGTSFLFRKLCGILFLTNKRKDDPYEKVYRPAPGSAAESVLGRARSPVVLCAGENEPLPPVREEPVSPVDPEEPGEPVRPMNDGDFPDHNPSDT